MSCVQNPRTTSAELSAPSTDARVHWFTDWTLATGFLAIKAVTAHKAVTGSFESRLVIQTAAVRSDDPGAPVAKEATWLSGSGGRCTGVVDVSSDTAGKFLVRVGVEYRTGNGSFAKASVFFDLSYLACGQLVGTRTLHLRAPDTTVRYVPISAPLPGLLAEKAAAAIVVTGASQYIQVKLAARKASQNRENPGAWAATGDS